MRAEYLARSGINLSRLLIKVQQSVLDKARQYIGDIQIADFAPILLKAFGGDTDDQAALGSLIGVDTSMLKGLGAGKGQSFDVAITSDDGLININCGGGLNDATRQQYLFRRDASAALAAEIQPRVRERDRQRAVRDAR